MGLRKMLATKVVWIVVAFTVFYVVGIGLGIVPQYMKDMVGWGADNFTTIVLLICFLVGAYLFNKFVTRKSGTHE